MTITDIKWWEAASIRCLKTFAQNLVALIGADKVSIVALDWAQILSIGATAALLSLLTSLAGLPEVDGAVDVPEVEFEEGGE